VRRNIAASRKSQGEQLKSLFGKVGSFIRKTRTSAWRRKWKRSSLRTAIWRHWLQRPRT